MPTEQIGRAITDIRAAGRRIRRAGSCRGHCPLKGLSPRRRSRDYADTLAAYTQGWDGCS